MKGLNVRAKTIILLKENIKVILHDLGLANGFLDMTSKALAFEKKKR